MKAFATLSGLVVAAVMSGCARISEPPPSADHPANPQAASAPVPEASATLATDQTPATTPAATGDAAADHADHSQHHGHEGHGK